MDFVWILRGYGTAWLVFCATCAPAREGADEQPVPRSGVTNAPGTLPSIAGAAPVAPASAVAPGAERDPSASFVVPAVVAGASERAPFVLLLHGYGGSGRGIARRLGWDELASAHRFIYAAPDGVADARGSRFWNAGPACCDFGGLAPDHVKSLGRLLDAARAHPRVDPKRIFIVGYSNGGFMAHRLACDVAGIAGIASIAGAVVDEPRDCAHAPATIIEVHGDADPVVPFEGGHVLGRTNLPRHLGAREGMMGWALRAGCDEQAQPSASFDLQPDLAGAETESETSRCSAGISLLRIRGGGHDVASSGDAMTTVLTLLLGR